MGSTSTIGKIYFHPYFTIKDGFSFFVALLFFSILIFFYPNLLGHPDNYIMANALVTPPHIVPEWYFLPFYAILRAIPNKIGGVIAMLAAILVFFTIPFNNNAAIKSPRFELLRNIMFTAFVVNFLLLGHLGGCAAEQPYIMLSQFCSVFHFFYVCFGIRMFNNLPIQQN
jgi:ubiquinol-cytochrome c reductase cytochrome b subunit